MTVSVTCDTRTVSVTVCGQSQWQSQTPRGRKALKAEAEKARTMSMTTAPGRKYIKLFDQHFNLATGKLNM